MRSPVDLALAEAIAARSRGALGPALAATQRAIDASPQEARAWIVRASLRHLAGDLEGASADYRRALASAPREATAHAALAVVLAQRGQRASAEAHLAAALTLTGPGELGEVTRLRAERQLRELAGAAPTAPWERCATPLPRLREGRPPRGAVTSGPAAGPRPWTLADLAALARARPRTVALTGAGLSAASGLCTRKELWRRLIRDEAVSAVRFHERPEALWAAVREFWGEAEHPPNPAHLALATWPGLQAIVTQNVDGLHQAARPGRDAPPVIELHGTLARTRCVGCGGPGEHAAPLAARGPLPPRCPCGAPLRPDVVLFGEPVPGPTWEAARAAVAAAELLLVVGCAMDVSPASELPQIAARAGARVVEIKRRPSRLADATPVHHLAGAAEDILPRALAAIEGGAPP